MNNISVDNQRISDLVQGNVVLRSEITVEGRVMEVAEIVAERRMWRRAAFAAALIAVLAIGIAGYSAWTLQQHIQTPVLLYQSWNK